MWGLEKLSNELPPPTCTFAAAPVTGSLLSVAPYQDCDAKLHIIDVMTKRNRVFF